ncbi:MAG: hypothetical protein PHP22_01800, partial [Oscillospiraceae bacterium]|nr:hypothetical protein [Oscillospiraceae bacterium]
MVLLSLVIAGALSAVLFFVASVNSVKNRAIDDSKSRADILSAYFSRHPEEMNGGSGNSKELLEDDRLMDSYVLVYDREGYLLQQTLELGAEDTEILIPLKNYSTSQLLTNRSETRFFVVIPHRGMFDQIIIAQATIIIDSQLSGYVIVGTPTRDSADMLLDFLEI